MSRSVYRVEIPVDQIGHTNQIDQDLDVPLPTDPDEYTTSRPYPCDFCSRRFRKKTNLMNHMVAHKNDRPHICNLCGARYIRRHDLLTHLKIHAQVPESEGILRCRYDGVECLHDPKILLFSFIAAVPSKRSKRPQSTKVSKEKENQSRRTEAGIHWRWRSARNGGATTTSGATRTTLSSYRSNASLCVPKVWRQLCQREGFAIPFKGKNSCESIKHTVAQFIIPKISH